MMGIHGVEGDAGKTIAIQRCTMLCMGLRLMAMINCSGLGPFQFLHTPKVTLYRAYIGMGGDRSQHGIPGVEGNIGQSITIW